MLNRAHTVVALYPEAAQVLGRRGVRSHVATIPNAVRSADFPAVTAEQRDAAREELGIAPGAPVILYLGAMSAEKRPERAVDVAELRPDWTVLLVGDGPLRPSVEARAEQLHNVDVHEPTPTPQRFLQAADVVVIPSDTEGVPAAAVETGLSGLPVVASDIGGVSHVIDHGTTGLLVPVGDVGALVESIQIALEHKEAMGSAARTRCLERFDITSVAGQWAEVLRGAVGAKAPSGQRRNGAR